MHLIDPVDPRLDQPIWIDQSILDVFVELCRDDVGGRSSHGERTSLSAVASSQLPRKCLSRSAPVHDRYADHVHTQRHQTGNIRKQPSFEFEFWIFWFFDFLIFNILLSVCRKCSSSSAQFSAGRQHFLQRRPFQIRREQGDLPRPQLHRSGRKDGGVGRRIRLWVKFRPLSTHHFRKKLKN